MPARSLPASTSGQAPELTTAPEATGADAKADEAQLELADTVAIDIRKNGCDTPRYNDFEKTIADAVIRFAEEDTKSDPWAAETATSYSHSLIIVADASLENQCLDQAAALYQLVLELPHEEAVASYQGLARAGEEEVAEAKAALLKRKPASRQK